MLKNIYNSVVDGNNEDVVAGVNKALDAGVEPEKIISEGLIKAMDEVGSQMKAGKMFVPEVLLAAEAMKDGLMVVKPLLEGESHSPGKVVLGTVSGDLHDIGKNLVGMLIESAGFDVIDLGVDVAAETFLEAVKEHKPQIVGMSALLTTTMTHMEKTIKLIKEKAPGVHTIVGGAPVSKKFAQDIGASGYAPDAPNAVDLVKNLVNSK